LFKKKEVAESNKKTLPLDLKHLLIIFSKPGFNNETLLKASRVNKNNIFEKNMEEIIPIEIPNTLLEKTRVKNKDIIGSKCNMLWKYKKE